MMRKLFDRLPKPFAKKPVTTVNKVAIFADEPECVASSSVEKRQKRQAENQKKNVLRAKNNEIQTAKKQKQDLDVFEKAKNIAHLRKNRKRNSLNLEIEPQKTSKRKSLDMNRLIEENIEQNQEAGVLNEMLGTLIYEKCMLVREDIDGLKNENEMMDLRCLYAYLSKISLVSNRDGAIIVISPEWSFYRTSKVWTPAQNETLPNARNMCFGNINIFEKIIIPLYVAGHFMVSIYVRNRSILFFDPLQNDGNQVLRQLSLDAIRQINEVCTRIERPEYIRFINAKPHRFNKQPDDDGLTCGYRVCLIVQNFLLFNENTYIINLNINNERQRIIRVLYSLLPGSEINSEQNNLEIDGSFILSVDSCRMKKNRMNRKEFENICEKEKQRKRMNDQRKGNKYRAARDWNFVCSFRLGPFNVNCKHCLATHFTEEMLSNSNNLTTVAFSSCCDYGNLKNLDNLIDDYPEELKSLFFSGDNLEEKKKHKNFMENVRRFNSLFACASICCSKISLSTPGPSVFKIQGQVYHNFNELAMPLDDAALPTNGQIFFVDTNEALNIRSNIEPTCDPELIKNIDFLLRQNYPYATSYKMMKDVYEEQKQFAEENGVKIPEIKLLFSLKKGFDPRNYNLPQANEVCAILLKNSEDEIIPANIVVHLKGEKKITNIYPLDSNVENMCFPLLYPNNTKGWSPNLKNLKGKNISLCDFVKYRLHIRQDGKFLAHFFAGKLFQQWVVDSAARIEWSRLQYIRTHQKEICKSTYNALDEYLKNTANKTGAEVGRRVVLPSSFTGSPRYMHNNFLDAVAISTKIGKPDLFITMTCNPNHEDILKCLNEKQSPSDRPDIVDRVFKLQSDQLLKDIIKDRVFGEVIGYLYVIEFQKRGLPHMHLLITLHEKDKLKTAVDIDKIISAEIPNEIDDKEVYDLVKSNMIHGPCGSDFPDKLCWDKKKNRCKKKFPHLFNEETVLSADGYPFYRRRNNGRFVYKKGRKMTNEHVVPHSPWLLKRFKCHINVEVVASIKAIKYLYKYFFKGNDSIVMSAIVQDSNSNNKILNYDEVNSYLDARYLSPCEAVWRIMKFPLQGKSHSVELLDVHLENEHYIHYEISADNENIKERMGKNSKLTAYFSFMTKNPDKKFLYLEMPEKCVWDSKMCEWKYPRKSHFNNIGRMYSVNPKEAEKFYLRILLCNVYARSFNDLKIVDGLKYDTYAQAALARNLCRNDDEWTRCLREASQFKFPTALRNLFSVILTFCEVKYPDKLWEEFKDVLSQDIQLMVTSKEEAYNKALFLINENLLRSGVSLNDFPKMPKNFEKYGTIHESDVVDVNVERNKVDEMYNKMNDDQKMIFDEFRKIYLDKQQLFFIDGPGGSGKSFLLTSFYHDGRANGLKICNMAYSGIAATLLKMGRTLHSRFKLPLNLSKESVSGIIPNSTDGNEIKKIDIFIVDELSMTPKYVLDIMDKLLKDLHKNKKLFGGKSVILAGDFRQCLAMSKNATESEIIDLLIKKSKLWRFFKTMRLSINMRADPNERIFAQELLDIGNGTAGENGFIKVKDCCICHTDLVDEIYGEILAFKKFGELKYVMIVAPLNAIVDNYNKVCLEKLDGEEITYLSIDECDYKSDFPIDPEVLNSFVHHGFPPHKLALKKDCVVTLLRNLNIEQGLCNGTRIQLLDVGKYVLRGIILNGDHVGEQTFIPRITLIEEKEFPFVLRRLQYPIKLGFACTIHKAQGQTYKKMGVDFQEHAFAHGMTYVAFARVHSWDCLKIKLADDNIEHLIRNVVWKDALI